MENCEKWRNCFIQLLDNVFGDCFEGRVWKEFQYVDGEFFFVILNNFVFMLNIDWFQFIFYGLKFICVIYMVVMNFLKKECFKFENFIVVGIIFGLKDFKYYINFFLQLLVDDFIDLWDGVILDINIFGIGEMF